VVPLSKADQSIQVASLMGRENIAIHKLVRSTKTKKTNY